MTNCSELPNQNKKAIVFDITYMIWMTPSYLNWILYHHLKKKKNAKEAANKWTWKRKAGASNIIIFYDAPHNLVEGVSN